MPLFINLHMHVQECLLDKSLKVELARSTDKCIIKTDSYCPSAFQRSCIDLHSCQQYVNVCFSLPLPHCIIKLFVHFLKILFKILLSHIPVRAIVTLSLPSFYFFKCIQGPLLFKTLLPTSPRSLKIEICYSSVSGVNLVFVFQ